MTDIKDQAARSYNMSRIRCKDTKPELIVRQYLFSQGFRYRLHVKNLPGKPDIVLPKYRTVIFVNGCFWHGHQDCKYYRLPKSRVDFWKNKVDYNRKNDANTHDELCKLGWNVIVTWECELKTPSIDVVLKNIVEKIRTEARQLIRC